MRISMVAIGSTGDVRPYVLLGKELKKRGHEVTIVCFDMTEKMVTEAGLNFAPLAGSVKDIFMAVMTPGTNGFTFLPKFKNALLDDLPQFLHTLEEGCKDAEAIICTFFGSVVYSIAEKHNIPCIQTHYFLMDYNDMFPITTAPGLKMGKAWNKVSYKMGYALINTLEWHYLSDWRSEEGMKSKKISMSPDYYINGHKIPVLYAISPLLVPRAPEWDEHIHMTGFWTDPEPCEYEPEPSLVRFLEEGEKPVYIGFGSMVSGDMGQTLDIVLKAVAASGVRAIIGRGWGGGALDAALSNPNVYVADYIPHDWLFSRVSAVVHHGGAGTTAAGVLACKPTLVVPFGGDQPFWGQRIYDLGIGPKPIKRENLTVEKLADALIKLTHTPRFNVAVSEIGERMKYENGTLLAADIVEREINDWIAEDKRRLADW
ncbi:MAG: glycosyltransferase [Clostridiales bacterium]|nr:glycosyltransferase [Clostridiales bacterium]MDD7367974.1 glycosyltransferase [Clostridiales bacterium]MDY2872117.1 glycosyltransferase [Eubacteriales bacterium]